MLDINFIRENRELVKEGLLNKGEKNPEVVDDVLELDDRRRSLIVRIDELRAESNARSKEIGVLMGQGKKEQAREIIDETSKSKGQIKDMELELENVAESREKLLLRIPNVPHESVPVGKTENDNVVHATWGEPLSGVEERQSDKAKGSAADGKAGPSPVAAGAPDAGRKAGESGKTDESPEEAGSLDAGRLKPHWELAESNGWIDFERGSKVTGAGFPFYVGPMARLQRALINFFINEAIEDGYTELQAPYFVNEASARGTGQIPDKEEMMYVVPNDGFFAIPTAEVPVTNFHRDEILPEVDLPVKYVAYTPCWRREAGSYGKDVRGLNRLHQFDKVELVKIVHPDDSYDELERLRGNAESLLRKLKLPYRTLLMCTGDMGFTQTKKYDLEVWSPGQSRWLEVSSCSNFTDFQARRMQLRYRDGDGKIRMVHTLNGSGLALPRVAAALLETCQDESGRVRVPDVLQPFMGSEWM